ncbi:hypothetical protein BaRGS_00040229 [Batillaria attramentaria]|uniref:Uncharacterized protein n=1 Tax=Batillaria attramentaria TaxID=370345 RepID=A0ABD0J179_9CAEN
MAHGPSSTTIIEKQYVYQGLVYSSQMHFEGTAVMGSENQVGNIHTEDRHDQHTQGSYNTGEPEGAYVVMDGKHNKSLV